MASENNEGLSAMPAAATTVQGHWRYSNNPSALCGAHGSGNIGPKRLLGATNLCTWAGKQCTAKTLILCTRRPRRIYFVHFQGYSVHRIVLFCVLDGSNLLFCALNKCHLSLCIAMCKANPCLSI
jgi:hypothetical protein